jgi:Spy/CpxP family protein refolding chaperone
MNWKQAAIAAATVVSIGTIPAHAQQGQEPPGMMGPGMIDFGLAMIDRLDPNDAQRRQVQRIGDELRRQNWDSMGKMLENTLDAAAKAEALLTPQQREQIRRFAP